MTKRTIKEKSVDTAFSNFIRERDNWTCQLQLHPECRGRVEPPTNKIQCSHFHTRTMRGTRFDPENADAACDKCHFAAEHQKSGWYFYWKDKQLGKSKMKALYVRSRLPIKFTQDDRERMIKEFKRRAKEIQILRDEAEGPTFGRRS